MCMCVVEVDSFQNSVLTVIVAMYVCVRVFVCLLSILRLAVSGTRTTGQLCFFSSGAKCFSRFGNSIHQDLAREKRNLFLRVAENTRQRGHQPVERSRLPRG